MISSSELREFIDKQLEESPLYLVDVSVKPDNQIEVEIDSDSPVSIEDCEALTRAIEQEFDRDKEDYTLEVGSAGLTSPFKVKRQYEKNIGNEVEVLTRSGKKLTGILKNVGSDSFTIGVIEKVKKPESKRPVAEEVDHTFGFDEVKYTKYVLKF